MTSTKANSTPYEALDRLFHEPNRLAIVSTLCMAEQGLPFTELRDRCHLTDGNLNRHLKALEEAGAVRIRKMFAGGKPLTLVLLTDRGRRGFSGYLTALNTVLKDARSALAQDKEAGGEWRISRAATT